MSLPALRALTGKHEHQLVGLIFDQPIVPGSHRILLENRVIADISSHVWSPRHRKHLALAMVKRDYLANHSEVEINGQQGIITDLPFSADVLNAATG